MRDEYDDLHWKLNRQLERDDERELRLRSPPQQHRKQFRYWSGMMFRPSGSNPRPIGMRATRGMSYVRGDGEAAVGPPQGRGGVAA